MESKTYSDKKQIYFIVNAAVKITVKATWEFGDY